MITHDHERFVSREEVENLRRHLVYLEWRAKGLARLTVLWVGTLTLVDVAIIVALLWVVRR